MSVLEDLVAATQELHPPELMAVLAMPRDEQATADIDWDKLTKKADLDEGERVLDAAVRGDSRSGQYVTFVVEGADQRTSKGFFPVADLTGRGKADVTRGSSGPADSQTADGAVGGGTASVKTDPDGTGDPDDQKVPPPAGVPGDITELNATKRKALITSPPEGVDPAAVAAWEAAQDSPAPSVIKAAQEAGHLPPPEGA